MILEKKRNIVLFYIGFSLAILLELTSSHVRIVKIITVVACLIFIVLLTYTYFKIKKVKQKNKR
jgi:membrane protein DedA with SNARE-associated domain